MLSTASLSNLLTQLRGSHPSQVVQTKSFVKTILIKQALCLVARLKTFCQLTWINKLFIMIVRNIISWSNLSIKPTLVNKLFILFVGSFTGTLKSAHQPTLINKLFILSAQTTNPSTYPQGPLKSPRAQWFPNTLEPARRRCLQLQCDSPRRRKAPVPSTASFT